MSIYNLINPHAECYSHGLCPNAIPYTFEGTHPNAEERRHHAFTNFARLFPKEYLHHPFGKHLYGRYGPPLKFPLGCVGDDSGSAVITRPMWMWNDANEMARFHALGCSECNTTCPPHHTCKDQCHLFSGGSCRFGPRADAFRFHRQKNALDDVVSRGQHRIVAEGECGANMCLASPSHCPPIFKPDRELMGVGASMSTRKKTVGSEVTNVYVDGNAIERYPIVAAAHFNLYYTVGDQDWKRLRETHGKVQITAFMVVYSSENNAVRGAWVWYKGRYHEMMKEVGGTSKGVWMSYLDEPLDCEPYYFVFQTVGVHGSVTLDDKGKQRTEQQQMLRMPPNERYYFGTAWMPYHFERPRGRPICTENHYYVHGSDENHQDNQGSSFVVVPNSGPGDLRSIAEKLQIPCIGCAKISFDDGFESLLFIINQSQYNDIMEPFRVVLLSVVGAILLIFLLLYGPARFCHQRRQRRRPNITTHDSIHAASSCDYKEKDGSKRTDAESSEVI